MVSTPNGTLSVDFPDGDVHINRHTPEEIKEHESSEAEAEWREMFEVGCNDNGMGLNLFDTDENNRDQIPLIAEITEAAGLGAPWVLNPEDGTCLCRWTPP